MNDVINVTENSLTTVHEKPATTFSIPYIMLTLTPTEKKIIKEYLERGVNHLAYLKEHVDEINRNTEQIKEEITKFIYPDDEVLITQLKPILSNMLEEPKTLYLKLQNDLKYLEDHKEALSILNDFQQNYLDVIDNNLNTFANFLASYKWQISDDVLDNLNFEAKTVDIILLALMNMIYPSCKTITHISVEIEEKINLIKYKLVQNLPLNVNTSENIDIISHTNPESPYKLAGAKRDITCLISALFSNGNLVTRDNKKVEIHHIRKATQEMINFINGDISMFDDGFISGMARNQKIFTLTEAENDLDPINAKTRYFYDLMKSFSQVFEALRKEKKNRNRD